MRTLLRICPQITGMFKIAVLGFGLLILSQFTVYSTNNSGVKSNNYFSERPYLEAALYKSINPRPLNRETSLHDLKIVVPDDPLWQKLGQQVADVIKSRWGIQTNISIPDPKSFSTGWSGNTIVLGNLGNNTQMARLYGLRMSYADAIYPGKGGYQLLTLIDPFGRGGNTVSIGASEISGARAGIDELISVLKKAKSPDIPWLFKARLSEEASKYFSRNFDLQKARQLAGKLKPVKDNETVATALIEVMSQIKLYGEYYQLTANPEFGKIFSVLLKEYTMFVNQYPEAAKNQLESRRNMWIQGEKLFQLWNVLEADPLFSQLDRSQILSALYLTCEANANDGYLVRAPETGPRWNHEIFPAVSLSGSCYYFEKYYKMPEILKWKKLGDQIFKGNTSYISLDEGSDYLVHVPMVNIDYAMASGDLKYIRQSLRPSADLHAIMIDNLGTMSGGGDTYPFGMSSAYSWGHSQVMNAASWYFNDPVYNFLLERTRTGPFPGQKMPDLNYPVHRYMVTQNKNEITSSNYPKVQAQKIETGVYNDLKAKEKLEVELENTFHKLTFRSGFGLDDNYLILDGFSSGRHGHQDGNTILNYSANGRLFLNDRDYIQNTPEYHSGLVIIKNGEQHKKPPLVNLEWIGDLDGTPVSRSQVPNYNGTDWTRTIISPEGKFYIIYDDLKIREDGDFIVKNLWQSLGTPQIQKNTFKVDQKGASMLIQSLTNAKLRLKNIYGHFIKYWQTVYPYKYADKETVLTEVIDEKRYAIGDTTGFINILSSYKAENNAVQSTLLNENTIEIKDGDKIWLATKGSLNADLFSSNGRFHLLGNKELIIASVSKVKIGQQNLKFPFPVFFKLNTASGEWKTFDLLKDKISYNELGNPVRKGAIDSGTVQWNNSIRQRLEQAIRINSNYEVIDHSETKPSSINGWKEVYKMNETITSSASTDLNNDGKDELLLAGISGTIKAVDLKGNNLWTFEAKGRVNEVSVQSTGTRRLIFIATENWYIQVLDTEGKEQWNYKFPDDAAHKEFKGNLIGITNIRLAYPNGKDQEPSIMVGTQFRYVYELDLSGKLKNATLLYFYGLEDMEYADLDADGKEEGMFGLEYYYYTLLKDKKLLTGKTGGPGWKVVDVLNKDDKNKTPAILLGSKQNEVRMIQFQNKMQELWIKNVGGEVNDIRNGDFNNDGQPEILVATEGFQLYVLNQDGSTVFRKTLGDRVLKVDGMQQNGKAFYLAATAHGRLFKVSAQGTPEQLVQFPAEIGNILTTNNGAWIVLENGDLYRMDQ
ncbi:MAG TPA: VCBS repeat-containing protein [Sphingobacteriaceae bacterium]